MKWKQFKIWDLIKNAIIHCWRVGKLVFLSLVFSSLFKCLSEIAEISFLQQLFSSVTLYLNNQNDMRNVISAVVGLGVILVLAQVIQLWEYLAQGYFWRRGNGYFHALLHERLGKEPALSYENPEFLNRYEKATVGCEDAPDAVECVCHMLCYYIPFFVLTVVYLYYLAPAMILAIVILLFSSLISEWIKARQTYEFENQVSDFNRKCEHYENCIVSKEYVKETRFLGAVGFFMKKYDDTMKMYHKKFLQKETNHLKNGILLNVVDMFGYLCIFGILLYYMKLGKIHVVEFATIYFAIDKVKHAMEEMVAMIGEAMQSVVRMSFLFEFLKEEITEKKEFVSKKNETYNEICLKNVSFSYPFRSKKVLENINLQIRKGETIAI